MKAIILAAGVGKRLWQVTQHRPKCLIEMGGRALMHRYLDALGRVGIRRATLVVGYKQEMIRAAVGTEYAGVAVSYLVNEQFHRGSISSLWIARASFDDDLIVMDADVLFHQEILRRLVESVSPNCLLMDETVKQTGEECMVVVEGGRVIALTKKMPLHYDYAGEGVGFLSVRHADTPISSRRSRDLSIATSGIWNTKTGFWNSFGRSRSAMRKSAACPGPKSIFPRTSRGQNGMSCRNYRNGREE